MSPDDTPPRPISPSADALARIKTVVGDKGWSDDADIQAAYVNDERGLYHGQCALLVRPESTRQVADVVTICHEEKIAIVPQGGNTGLVGAGVPHDHGAEILLSLGRMNNIRDIDPLNYTVTVEAGCILANLQDAAANADRLFPLSLGAEGTCQIGGNISTNAGGVNVLRYGNARELVLGLEVVLPDGRIWDGLKRLRKDNTGYDLKQLFIGAEGTLGIITAAVCKLFPNPKDVQTAFVALRDLDASIELLADARAASGDRVTSFELICRTPLDFAARHIEGVTHPIDGDYQEYALMEFSGARANSGMGAALESLLETAFENGQILDAIIAQSESQRRGMWRIREGVVLAQAFEGGSIKHDISVAVSRVPEFIRRANAAAEAFIPGIRPVVFGHCGDGNLHYNYSQPLGADADAFIARWPEVKEMVHDIVEDMNGSFSAEHGVGQLKMDDMLRYKSPLELDLMRRFKRAIDPNDIMNPGKIV
ncbi:MAG: FAD-binding oxidoreductase [Rhodospirillaceae bacterium]|jgi:FAD/FMN-containing dehydrogenase|nr:FAD-binding oxidoreductase [Rhodospirillaceae bacterium]